MRISHKYKCVFIAVPRTGSTSIRAVLDELADVVSVTRYETTAENPFYHHISASELKKIFESRDWNWDEYTKFCVVRNPFDRCVSLYHHRKDTHLRVAPNKPAIFNFVRKLKYKYFYSKSFSDWLRGEDFESGLCRSIRDFTGDENGNSLVDHFLKFENLDAEFSRLSELVGFSELVPEIEKKNSSQNRSSYHEYYNEELIEIVRRKYSYEINEFGYEF